MIVFKSMNRTEETVCFSELCRLCLQRPGIYNVFKIKGLIPDIYEVTGVKVFLFGDLPQAICHECSAIINSAKFLRDIANKNDLHMRTLSYEFVQPIVQINEEKVFVEDNSYDNDSSGHDIEVPPDEGSHIKVIKTEDATFPKDPLTSTDKAPSIPELVVRSDFFSDSDITDQIKESPTSHYPPHHPSDNRDPNVPQVTVRNDLFSSSLQIEPCSDINDKKVQIPNMKCKQTSEQTDIVYRCEMCAKDFVTWKKFYYHNRGHNKTIECFVAGCRKKFASNGDLEKHVRTHTGEKPYQCEICSRRFAQRVTLKNHREAVHNLFCEVIIGS